MFFKDIEICCPACRGELDWPGGSQSWICCRTCQQQYPVAYDIPDLRVFSDPYISAAEDRAKGLMLAERFNDLDFGGLIDYYYSKTSVVPPQHAQRYKRGLLAGVHRAKTALNSWQRVSGEPPGGKKLLDIGCGTGPLLEAASGSYSEVVGVDIAFRWLVVGKKRLAQAGLDLPLICACAEALPFPDDSFNCVVADSVIEHTHSQADSLQEARRVMADDSVLYLSTPNKLSLGPDPHTGLPAGGLLPQKLSAAYVRRLGGIPPQRRLLSVVSLQRLMKETGFPEANVFLPDVPEEQRALFPASTRKLIDAYHLAKKTPVSRQLLYLIGPLLYAVARPAPKPDPTLNRSRQPAGVV